MVYEIFLFFFSKVLRRKDKRSWKQRVNQQEDQKRKSKKDKPAKTKSTGKFARIPRPFRYVFTYLYSMHYTIEAFY